MGHTEKFTKAILFRLILISCVSTALATKYKVVNVPIPTLDAASRFKVSSPPSLRGSSIYTRELIKQRLCFKCFDFGCFPDVVIVDVRTDERKCMRLGCPAVEDACLPTLVRNNPSISSLNGNSVVKSPTIAGDDPDVVESDSKMDGTTESLSDSISDEDSLSSEETPEAPKDVAPDKAIDDESVSEEDGTSQSSGSVPDELSAEESPSDSPDGNESVSDEDEATDPSASVSDEASMSSEEGPAQEDDGFCQRCYWRKCFDLSPTPVIAACVGCSRCQVRE